MMVWNLARLLKDRGGNFGMMTAVLLPVTLGSAGVVMDVTNAMQAKNTMQGFADAAALAAASSMSGKNITPAQAQELARSILAAQMAAYSSPNSPDDAALANKDVKDNTNVGVTESGSAGSGKTFDIVINASYNMKLNPMMNVIGFKTMKISVTGSATSSTEAKNALSMFLVVDRSGSMKDDTATINAAQPTKVKQESYQESCTVNGRRTTCTKYRDVVVDNYVTKIEALKVATQSLLDTIKTADNEVKYARLAAVSYNNVKQTSTPLAWGTTAALAYVNNLTASGNTNSGEAMQEAYESLNKPSENTAHQNKSGQSKPSKYIIFMTDGANNLSGADTKTKTACANAKTAGMEIYSVAFMAPTAGQKLLETCATNPTTHYYKAENAVQLVAAFKSIGEKAAQAATRLTN